MDELGGASGGCSNDARRRKIREILFGKDNALGFEERLIWPGQDLADLYPDSHGQSVLNGGIKITCLIFCSVCREEAIQEANPE